ncbi:uncharacterized protein KNAG_0A04930 [Huiozyma naganishii CBS 8797]|uniref:Auxin efflux carrier component n=1 Tax=Huiozyma naganishii (strain ATCC MYA-139 / BCRC 22969 / CBS 8797 / KCTC 17520 / NBRC 10181 / NCYC 3082 / Yp74L-3) TaxID=1071383 RepID=J7S3S7_HUIN7|nr:hypothetical protein KNAG_0A04930 [Kazachstania naganishii CBS 8797]CCK68161.1 hypothetical protein KNAG_0A04930 [Kazachstania naganishii CBS 8797]
MSITIGAAIYIALKPILKIYAIIFVGFLLAKYDIVNMETAKGISNMVVNAILPCLTFNKIVTNISWHDIKEIGVIILSAVLLFSVGMACSVVTKLTTPVPKNWFWGLIFSGIFPNISDLPIAYLQSMGNGAIFSQEEADKGVAYTCIFLFTQSFFMMNFGMWRIVGLDFKDVAPPKEKDSEQHSDLEMGDTKSSDGTDAQDNTRTVKPNLEAMNKKYRHSVDSGNEVSSIDSEVMSYNSIGNVSAFPVQYSDSIAGNRGQALRSRTTDSTSEAGPALFMVNSSPGVLQTESGGDSAPVDKPFSVPRSRGGLRHRHAPSVNDMIGAYSVAHKIRTGELDLSRPLTLTEDIGASNTAIGEVSISETSSDSDTGDQYRHNITRTSTAVTTTASHGRFQRFIRRYKLEWLVYFIINFIRPASLGALLGIICALIPWVKACFVSTYVHVHKAPDGQPVLNFLIDFTGYIGNACVPLGLLLLGGTLARLQVSSLPPGFIRSALLMTVFRLMVIPIVGVAWADKLYNINWLDSRISKFVMILTWAMPSATAQIYFTAFYTPMNGKHTQMDCLSVLFIIQYSVLFITLSFVVTYDFKEVLKCMSQT